MMAWRTTWMRGAAIGLVVLIAVVAAGGAPVWWKLFRSEEQDLKSDLGRFNYGSLGADLVAGIPYPIFMVLPRVFPDLIEQYATQGYGPQKAGHGGYGAFGLAWEEGARLPVGLSIKRLGYERVTLNCALCHTASYRLEPGDTPRFAFGGPGHTVNLQGLLRFLFAASHDARFNAARLLPEIALHFPLDWIDGPLYALYLIPKTRLALRVAEQQLGWMATRPGWGPGRDDAFNLPKFILTQTAWDNTIGNTDFPALWRLADRDGYLLHSGGEAKDVYAVVASSALGVGSLPLGSGFEERNRWIENFLRTLEPPKFPDPLDETLASRGRALFEAQCSSCHAKGGARIGTAIALDEIGTDPEHVRTWTQHDADRMNEVTGLLGMRASPLQGAQGYVARPLVGVWLLGPYLHNGSVPTLWDLLSPAGERPSVFYRGYDVVDRQRVGFIAQGGDAEARGFRFDTTLRGNGNRGHEYGTTLSEVDRRALIEYLKGL